VQALRAFFDTQSRVKLAVWVRHEQQDHHLMLGVDDGDFATGDMWALELGLRLPPLQFEGPTWIPDIFPLSEVEALRSFATVVWQGSPTGGDPLDYRLTWEPLDAAPDARERFAALVAAEPSIRRVVGTRRRLWDAGDEVEATDQLFVEADDLRHAVASVHDAARTAHVVSTRFETTLGPPRDPRVTVATIYAARA
jgi:hypothetical protein